MSFGVRLKYARERAGLTGQQVQDRTGIGKSSLSEFEKEKREPSISQLDKLAKLYHRSISFFFEEGDIPSETVCWRKRPQEMEVAKEAETRFLQLCKQYHNLEMWTNEKETPDIPYAEGSPDRFGYPEAENLATTVRKSLHLGDHPATELFTCLEEVWYIKIFHDDRLPDGTAISAVSETFGPAILLNANNAPARRPFDLAHELFHILTHRIFRSERTDCVNSDKEEKLATCFAGNLLMPPEAIKSAVARKKKDEGKLPYETLIDIAREFGVSTEALLWHLHILYRRGKTGEAKTNEQIKNIKKLEINYPARENIPAPLIPQRYYDLAARALRNGEMSLGRFAEYVGISRHKAMEILERESVADEEIEFTSL